MSQIYGTTGTDPGSSIGDQLETYAIQRKALIELQKEKYFSQLADVTPMPAHMGKTIKYFHYIPLLDDRNINDQGIDAAGAILATTQYTVHAPALVNSPANVEAVEAAFTSAHLTGEIVYITDSTQWLLITADTAVGYNAATAGGTSGTELSDAEAAAYLTADTAGGAHTVADGVITLTQVDLMFTTEAAANYATSIIAGSSSAPAYGNLYGSSKDIGTVQGKLPALSETGGAVNRVGNTRETVEGSIEKFGFYETYTEESLKFDTDAGLMTHINREMLYGAHELTEDMLQIDLLENAGVEYFPGAATVDTLAEISGETDAVTEVAYADLIKLDIELTNNRCPKQTKIITGSRMTDTKVLPACRLMYCGSEMQPTIMQMTDYHSNAAFIPLAQYAAAGTEVNGEIGAVGPFRVVIVPEMLHHAGVGAVETTNAGYRTTNGRYDAFPMLVVGSESFSTIGFETSGKSTKFRVFKKAPGEKSITLDDPYGETGIMSIKWWYGFLPLRLERLAVIWSAAQV